MSTLENYSQQVPSPKQSFPELEKMVLAYWQENNTFEQSVQNRQDCTTWTFYDGPPFANGLPHYGHLLTGYAKDTFPRFQTMRGKCVERVFGWDTHGLPAELEAMKQLGLTETAQVHELGVEKFNDAAREAVLRYTDQWKDYVNRQGRWVDFENGYKTLDLDYMESVMWAFKSLYEKDLAYEGYRVLPYCWKDQTPLSNHELNMDNDVYKVRNDTDATVEFTLTGDRARQMGLEGVRALAWTTTPWTLPMNFALAVHPEMTYVVVKQYESDVRYLVAQSRLETYSYAMGLYAFDNYTDAVVATFTGAELVGVRYEPLFDYYTDVDKWGTQNAWQFLAADYVSDSSGTGAVHLSPAHGEEDQKVAESYGVPTFLSVDESAHYLPSVVDFAGMHVFDAVDKVVNFLREKRRVFSSENYAHEYPHCWRCGNPLVYKAVSSWFVATTKLRDRMLELNEEVKWTPEHVGSGAFAKWLEGTRDWSVSRNRFFGSPVPVWKSDDENYPRVDVYGSLEELQRDFGVEVTDLHRPFVDELTRPNPDDPTGRSMMRRVPEVLDVWFDSGCMPFAQMNYPFKNVETFESGHPADFVVEYVGQVRGWFYVMHTLSTALFDKPAFKNAVSHGVVLGNDGLKMSKSKLNYPDVAEVFSSSGSDAMRWYLLSSPILRGSTLTVNDDAVVMGVREVMLPLWNAYCFYRMYLPEDYVPTHCVNSVNVLDVYLVSKFSSLVEVVTNSLESFDATAACVALRDFMDMLNNWYVRRSRNRLGKEQNKEAFDTLYTVLTGLVRLCAPLLPMLSEVVHMGLSNPSSVHLADYPVASDYSQDSQLEEEMEFVRAAASAGLGLRKKNQLPVRQQLSSLTLVTMNASSLEKYVYLLREELNVEVVHLQERTEEIMQQYAVTPRLKLNSRAVGRRLGKDAQAVFTAARNGDFRQVGDQVEVAGHLLNTDEFELVSQDAASPDNVALLTDGTVLMLDTVLTPELEAEAAMRDASREERDKRKISGEW